MRTASGSRRALLHRARALVVCVTSVGTLFSCSAHHGEVRSSPPPRATNAASSGSGALLGPGVSNGAPPPTSPRAREVALRLIAFNDFHGNLLPLKEGSRPIGGAMGLAAYIRDAQQGFEGRSLIIHAGDAVGASPPESGLLQDEPTINFLNALCDPSCDWPRRDEPSCDVVGTLGNHEFDEGVPELLRLLYGGTSAKGVLLDGVHPGARFPHVSANVVERVSGKRLLPPYVVRRVGGVRVGVIGAVLRETPGILNPAAPGIADLRFEGEVEAVNRAASELVSMGIRFLVLTIHQGLEQAFYEGPTRRDMAVSGALLPITAALHDEIDVIVSGHTHAFTNAYVSNGGGAEFLVTQALSAGRALATIDVLVDGAGVVTHKVATVNKTYLDVSPGNRVEPAVQHLVEAAVSKVRPQTERLVGLALDDVPRKGGAEDSPLGSLVADAHRRAGNADFALTNLGGIRADLPKGPVTWGRLFTVQPFGNRLVRVEMTGRQLRELLERQWQGTGETRFLQISGFTYQYDESRPTGGRILGVRKLDGRPISMDTMYRVVVNDYLVGGGDEVSGLSSLARVLLAETDLDALVRYFERHPSGLRSPRSGRIQRAP